MFNYTKSPKTVVHDIPRFVSDEYATNFGLQWRTFATVQLDSRNGTNLSKGRLERCLGTSINELKGLNVLEAGCGAARFTEHLVGAGANVHCIDLSSAVDANKEIIGDASNYQIAQASIYDIPYQNNMFDVVICLGVVQHTPNPEKTIFSLWEKVKPGGKLVIDHYRVGLKGILRMSNIYRRYILRMQPERALSVTGRMVERWFPLHWAFKERVLFQHALGMISPVTFYFFKNYPHLTKDYYLQLAKLDTHDYLTDYYKHFRSIPRIRKILAELPGAEGVEVWKGGNGAEARVRKAVAQGR